MGLIESLGIKIDKQTKDEVILSMAVTDNHKQPFGLVHGGMYGVLVETAASLGGLANVDEGEVVVGIDLQVNHLKAVRKGVLTTIAKPNHVGRTLQVWEVTIFNDAKQKIAVGRCSVMNRKK